MEGYVQKIDQALKDLVGKYLVGPMEEKDRFFAGFEAYKKKKPEGSGENFGNLATMPHYYLAVFWREFAELKSIKEAYFALLCMFDGKEALAGSFETFRKRANTIGLKYPTSSRSS